MNRPSPSLSQFRSQKGFILVGSIFLMIVVGLLIVFLLRTNSANHWNTSATLQQNRAFQAASSGLDWGLYQINAGACPVSPSTLTLNEADLQGFQVTITCGKTDYVLQSGTRSIFELDSVATFGVYGVSTDFVSRHLQLTVEGP